jgi:nucleotide-binding universal stress UspA family protein
MTTEPEPAAPSGVVVGVDGSQAGTAALHWAADTAATYRAPLTIVFARPDVEGDVVEAEQEEQLLDRSASDVRERQPELVVRALRYPDPPVQAMLAASADADMLVLGSRGLGGFRGLLMGSTAMQVVPWARCPVVVIHPPRESDGDEPLHPGQVVLGYDGSEQADAAAVLAFGHARAIGSGVVAVAVDKARGESRVEDVDPATASLGSPQAGYWAPLRVIAEEFTDVPVRFRHGRGRPAGILVDEAHGCALAVVGARGLGGFVGLLMGSVSQQVLAHADCPVAIVRPPFSE